uniref:Uncharacterized protein n=1 Tax=Heterorhabditis bacteriophora TaxID=37862 RepID=A0A1I7WBM6_HETBA
MPPKRTARGRKKTPKDDIGYNIQQEHESLELDHRILLFPELRIPEFVDDTVNYESKESEQEKSALLNTREIKEEILSDQRTQKRFDLNSHPSSHDNFSINDIPEVRVREESNGCLVKNQNPIEIEDDQARERLASPKRPVRTTKTGTSSALSRDHIVKPPRAAEVKKAQRKREMQEAEERAKAENARIMQEKKDQMLKLMRSPGYFSIFNLIVLVISNCRYLIHHI